VSQNQTRTRAFASWRVTAAVAFSLLASGPLTAKPATAAADVNTLLKAAEIGDLQGLQIAQPTIAGAGPKALADARLDAARFDEARAERDLKRYFASGDTDPVRQATAWSIAAEAAFAQGDYAAAAKAAAKWTERLPSGDPRRKDAAQIEALGRVLAAVPRQSVIASSPVPIAASRDKVGLMKADALINGQSQKVIVDTGANLSVVSASVAKRLNLRVFDGAASVGSSTRDAVPVKLALADRVEFAGFSLSHVAFLVLDDAQLALPLPGGYQIEAIVGFPVLRSMKRIQFTSDGRFVPESAPISRGQDVGELRIVGSDLLVTARLGGIVTPLHLDTGAPESSLSALFAASHPEVLTGLDHSKTRTAGAGGANVQEIATWRAVPVEIAGRTMTLPSLPITISDPSGTTAKQMGLLGGDILGAFCSFTLDFQRATFELGDPKRTGGLAACGQPSRAQARGAAGSPSAASSPLRRVCCIRTGSGVRKSSRECKNGEGC